MEKPISRKQHGLTDYSYIPLALAAPKLFGFSDDKKAVAVTRVLAANIVASSFFTRAEWGVVKVMPYKYHLILDVANGAFALSAPFLFGFAKNKKALGTFIGLGLMGILAGTLSREEEMPPLK